MAFRAGFLLIGAARMNSIGVPRQQTRRGLSKNHGEEKNA